VEVSGRPHSAGRQPLWLSRWHSGDAVKTIVEGEGDAAQEVPNPAYTRWYLQDQSILGGLRSSMHEDVLAQITREETSAAVWTSLHAMFSAQNEGNAIGIRTQLSNCRRHDMPASDYYHKMVSMADTMANIGEPLKDFVITRF
jgi:endonuclease/exonuclease/phosphatase family metal-dependent hydrolase